MRDHHTPRQRPPAHGYLWYRSFARSARISRVRSGQTSTAVGLPSPTTRRHTTTADVCFCTQPTRCPLMRQDVMSVAPEVRFPPRSNRVHLPGASRDCTIWYANCLTACWHESCCVYWQIRHTNCQHGRGFNDLGTSQGEESCQ